MTDYARLSPPVPPQTGNVGTSPGPARQGGLKRHWLKIPPDTWRCPSGRGQWRGPRGRLSGDRHPCLWGPLPAAAFVGQASLLVGATSGAWLQWHGLHPVPLVVKSPSSFHKKVLEKRRVLPGQGQPGDIPGITGQRAMVRAFPVWKTGLSCKKKGPFLPRIAPRRGNPGLAGSQNRQVCLVFCRCQGWLRFLAGFRSPISDLRSLKSEI